METKYKPIGTPDEFLKFGAYFKSENDINTTYLISVESTIDNHVVVKIYTTDILENHFSTDDLNNGNVIGLEALLLNEIAEIDLWGKYFFPKFKNDLLMLYYDDEKYYSGRHKSDSIASLMECINFAIEYGLKAGDIKPC